MSGKEAFMHSKDRSVILGTMPMSRLVPKVSIPIMFSMLIAYTSTDVAYISGVQGRYFIGFAIVSKASS